eukprot:TRINITY_DN5205_c0_g1_i1.p1 TRINITY_DN5205_c0_g1~~TRINITY_DN5205_c0_g1_i1.p1  ORF type:complete len:314 (+),score=57.40 TRINITY_DN5205_c0_g1_i1:115-942(+)
MPQADADHTITVSYLAAPLMYCSLKDELTILNGYHGGIGFTNTNTNTSYTINYDAYPSFSQAVFPGITTYPNGTTNMEWSIEGRAFIYEGINTTYWHIENKEVAKMNGIQYNAFLEWLAVANKTFTRYDTVAVYKDYPGTPWLDGFECFQFVFELIKKVQELGGKLTPGLTHLHMAVASIYTNSKPQVVDFDGPYHNEIIKFYQALELQYKQLGIINFIGEILKLLLFGDAYLFYENQYYKIDAAFPYFKQHWTLFPLYAPNSTKLVDYPRRNVF